MLNSNNSPKYNGISPFYCYFRLRTDGVCGNMWGMKKSFLLILSLAFSLSVRSQLYDSFSDGDLSADPAWYGQTGLFVVENGELRLADPDPGSSNVTFLYLPAPTSTGAETVWEWYVRLDFAPSSSNYARIYLQASIPELPAAGQTGYFLRIGGVSGDADALELYRQDPDDAVLLLSGASGALGAQPATARIRVVRDTSGLWSLWADYSGGNDLQAEGSAVDTTYLQGAYAGLVCYYTATRNDDFYFDDIGIDPLYVDVEPPQLLGATPLDAYRLEVLFNEPLDEVSATDPLHYHLSGGIGQPADLIWDVELPGRVGLEFSQAMSSGQEYTLETSGILDQEGNASGLQTASFTFLETFPGAPYEVLITEIMADPSPPVALPEAEYLELYNRSGSLLQLEGWTLSDGGAPAVFPPCLLYPGERLLVCDPADTMLLSPYGKVIGLAGFPALNNSGDHLVLRNASGSVIFQAAYSIDWYADAGKDEGGWSFELINPLAPCAGGENWRASESPLGGTPGAENAVWKPEEDKAGPIPLSVFPEEATRAVVVFSESLDSTAATRPENYSIEPGPPVLNAIWSEENPVKVELEWATALESGQRYTLSFDPALTDCQGNSLTAGYQLDFGLPEPPGPGDVVINEVLFQPEAGGAEFVELYNRSGKIINLGGLILANMQAAGGSMAPVAADRLLLPGEYVVFSKLPSDLLVRYPVAQEVRIVSNDLPVLPDGGGNLTLYGQNPAGAVVVLDAMDYNPDWHHPLLRETRGVSLERIDPYGDSRSEANWHSAASAVGYATPTQENSQHLVLQEKDTAFFLPLTVFSPDGDGEADFLVLQYQLAQSGYTASIRIFDAWGRLVSVLAQNELLGASGHFRWDGVDQNGNKARLGVYLLWIQWVHPSGEVHVSRKTCVLAGRI
jgi:hypothetical protein